MEEGHGAGAHVDRVAKVQLLERHFAHLIDYEFTAQMEEALDLDRAG